MSDIDTLYQALKEYRRLTDSLSEAKSFFAALKAERNGEQHLDSITTVCLIDKDWVEEIDKAMPFIADAVAEERQFVRSEGEVVDIEKVRVVGKESVEDLAKHSNYISREPEEDGRIIPDKILMPKKDNDYSIYENRFLYSLLIYLSQFIEIRLNEILSLSGKYQAESVLEKKVTSPKREMTFSLRFNDTRYNDPLSEEINGSDYTLDTIKKNLTLTKILLTTPLMKSVRNAPMVKPPITKTNILRFDTNFKKSLALYQFLLAYDKKGFTVKEIRKSLSPFPDSIREDFYELVYLTSFLTYEYGNNLRDSLEKTYQENQKKKKAEEDEKILAEIRRVQGDITRSGMSSEEYVLLLEKGEKVLEKKVLDLNRSSLSLKNFYLTKIKNIEADFQEQEETDLKKQKANLDSLFQSEKQKVLAEKAYEEKRRLQAENDVAKARNEVYSKVQEAAGKKEVEKQKMASEYEDKLQAKDNEISSLNQKIAALEAEAKERNEQISLLSGSVNALRNELGKEGNIDFTSKENFAKLEEEKEAFDRLFEKEWKKTKKQIRKEKLSLKAIRNLDKQNSATKKAEAEKKKQEEKQKALEKKEAKNKKETTKK